MQIVASRRQGSIRIGLFFLGITVALLWMGGQGLYIAMANRKPTVVGYDEYVKTRPKATWLVLTNAVLDLSDSSYKSVRGGNRPIELYVPVRLKPSDLEDKDRVPEKVHVLLATKDPQLMTTFMEMDKLKSDEEAEAWFAKNVERAFPRRDVKGVVRFGIDLKEKESRQLAQLQPNLATGFIILDDSKEPEFGKSAGLLLAGMMCVAGGVFFVRRSREETSADY